MVELLEICVRKLNEVVLVFFYGPRELFSSIDLHTLSYKPCKK